MTKTDIKIGLIGCGRWGRYILRDLKALGAQVWVVATSDIGRANAEAYKADHILPTIEDLPKDLDGFVVATTTIYHFSVVRSLLSRKKPVFVEKPFSINVEDIDNILNNEDQQVYVMHKWRYHPAIIKIKEIIDNSVLGQVLNIHCIRNQWGSPHKDVDTVWIHLPHDLSIIWHLLGEIPPLNYSRFIYDKDQNIRGIRAELGTNIGIMLEHNCLSLYKERNLWVQFEKGILEMTDPLNDHLNLIQGYPEDQNKIEKILIPTVWPLYSELEHFIHFLRNPQNPLLTPLHEERILIEHLHLIRNHAIKPFQ